MQSPSDETRQRAQRVWSAVMDAARAISSVGDAVGLSSIHLGVLRSDLAEPCLVAEAARHNHRTMERRSHVTPDPLGLGYIRIIGFGVEVDGVRIEWQYDVPATEEEYTEYCRQKEERQRAVRQEARP